MAPTDLTLPDLAKAIARDLRAYLRHDGEAARTDYLRSAAADVVEARSRFFTGDGSPDWRGRSYAYRRFMGEVFSAAGVSPTEAATVQDALRYHVSNVLRDRLDATTLEALGLRTKSARERSVEKREGQSALVAVLRGGAAFAGAEEVLQAAHALVLVASRLDPAEVRQVTPKARRDEALHALREAEARLAEAVSAATARRG